MSLSTLMSYGIKFTRGPTSCHVPAIYWDIGMFWEFSQLSVAAAHLRFLALVGRTGTLGSVCCELF